MNKLITKTLIKVEPYKYLAHQNTYLRGEKQASARRRA
jgi:hypothetical protein